MITELIEDYFNNNLLYNELTGEIEFDGNSIGDDLDNLYIQLGKKYNLDLGKNKVYDCAVDLAKDNKYHPIKNYLDSLTEAEPIAIEVLGLMLFGVDESIYCKMLINFLIGAVARVYQPACKVDSMLILQGKQGINKSSFFRTLFGDNWFTDNLTSNLNRDDLLIAHKHWCVEMDELDRITNKKEAGAIKAFISKQRDDFRKPYGKSIQSYPRSFVLGGTCNKSEFLVDETGSRRFWVIPVKDKINLELVSQERDRIWYTAKLLYSQGEKWWFDGEDENVLAELNKTYEVDDSWQKVIEDANIGDTVTVFYILEIVLKLDNKDHTRQNQMRVTNILKKLGYEKKHKRIEGKISRVWTKE